MPRAAGGSRLERSRPERSPEDVCLRIGSPGPPAARCRHLWAPVTLPHPIRLFLARLHVPGGHQQVG